MKYLNDEKQGEHEAEVERIKNVILTILRDMKKDMDNGEQPGNHATSAMIQTLWEEVKAHGQEPPSMDVVANIAAKQVGKVTLMDEEATDLFRQLMIKMIEQTEE